MSHPTHSETGGLEFWLTRDGPDGPWKFSYARFRSGHMSTRMAMDSPKALDTALAPAIAEILHSRLWDAQETTVHSESDFAATLPGLEMKGLRVLTRIGPNGSAAASIRFVQTAGDVSAVFANGYRPNATPMDSVETVAAPVLHELLLPALEVFDHILENGLTDRQANLLTARIKTMRAKRDELSDYIALLTRVVEGDLRDIPARSATSLDEAESLKDEFTGIAATERAYVRPPAQITAHSGTRAIQWTQGSGHSREARLR